MLNERVASFLAQAVTGMHLALYRRMEVIDRISIKYPSYTASNYVLHRHINEVINYLVRLMHERLSMRLRYLSGLIFSLAINYACLLTEYIQAEYME